MPCVRHAALLLSLAMVTGGANAAGPDAPLAPGVRPSPWYDDPEVGPAFEVIVARCRFIFTQPLRPLRREMLLKGDEKPATYELAGMTHDLTITSHPVRPFLGWVRLRYALVLKDPPADAQAQAEEARNGTRIVETLEFALQDRRWTFRGVSEVLVTGDGDHPGLRVVDKTPPEGRAEHAAAVKACLAGL